MNTLVVLGSWGRDKKSYYRLIENKPEKWEIYVPSYNDFVPNGIVKDFKSNLINYLNERNIHNFVLLGHSLGGALALSFAKDHPEKVKQLILVDSIGIKSNKNILSLFIDEVRVQLDNIRIAKKLDVIYKIEVITTWEVLTNPIMYLRLAWYVSKINLEKIAEAIKIDTLIIWGEDDYLAPLSDGKKLHMLISNSKFISFKGLNHEWILHYPNKLWKLLEID